MLFNVYISKYYFPREIWPKVASCNEIFELRKVHAASRTEAALKVWAAHGARWRSAVSNPHGSISLNVGRATRATAPEAGRLQAVRVLSALRPSTQRKMAAL